MFNGNHHTENKKIKTIYDHEYGLSVRCKTVIDAGSITNYLINIEDYDGGITILLDKDGNSMLSQIKL